ncbi:hypothetical protein E4U58_006095 [Claviceps cyperi]|nr:hypothetical protein E4U58_006095 [Claviceps cyperi]
MIQTALAANPQPDALEAMGNSKATLPSHHHHHDQETPGEASTQFKHCTTSETNHRSQGDGGIFMTKPSSPASPCNRRMLGRRIPIPMAKPPCSRPSSQPQHPQTRTCLLTTSPHQHVVSYPASKDDARFTVRTVHATRDGPNRILLHATVATTMRYSSDARLTDDRRQHYHKACKARVLLYGMENTSLTSLQALVILALHVVGSSE